MPITFELDPDHGLVMFRHLGIVPDEELLTFYEGFFSDSTADGYTRLLIQLDETRSTSRSSEALRSLVDLLQRWVARTRVPIAVAVVAPGDNSFGMARMYQAMSARLPWDFQVFREAETAMAWLDLNNTESD